MFDRIKRLWENNIKRPLSNLLQPVKFKLAAWLEPVGQYFQPYKERFDEQWAAFALNYPRLSVWVRRGTKLAAVLYVCYFVFAIGLFGEIPSVEELKEMQTLNTSEVYTADSVVIGKFYKENRKDIQYEDIPKQVVDALISTEDKRYWTHSGVDFWALGRVFWYSIVQGDERSGGGSTLSQQLAKNLFGRKRYTLFSTPINKVREMLIARRLERAYDKKDLLAFYLNTVPFGGNVFGIEMASQRFFNKTVKDLKVEQGAVLVGMLQKNNKYNPRRFADASRKRRDEVLNNMVENGKLDKAVCEKLKKDSIKLNYQITLNRDNMASYFKDYLRTQMPKILENYKKDDGTPYDIYKDGLKIYTSIDSKMQLLAEEAVHERMSKLQRQFDDHWSGEKWWGDDKWIELGMRNSDRWKKLAAEGWEEKRIRQHFLTAKMPITLFVWENGQPSEDERTITPMDSIKYYFRQLNTGFMALDPKTGLIKAWVGGTDFNYFQYDHVKSHRQVGSTFKPIVYARAIQAGISPCDYIPNRLTAYMSNGNTKDGYDVTTEEKESGKAWVPKNSGDGYGGAYSLEGALTNSVNVVSAYLIHQVGYRSVQDLAKQMGVTSEMQNDLSIALGTADISLFDMMKVYGTFAARGRRPEPISVLKIATRDGKIIADFTKDINPSKWQKVLTVDEADIMTRMMKSVVDEGTAGRLRSTYDLTNDIAGKTGTTQSQSDGWFMGYTPNLVVGTWVGGITPIVRFRDMSLGQGANMALPICGIFLKKLYATPQYAALKKEKFPEPAKWIKDSMDCNHRQYSEEEANEMNSLNLLDSLNILNQNLVPPVEKNKHDLTPDDNNDLRDKNSREDISQNNILPSVKPEQKNQTPLLPPKQQPKQPPLPQSKPQLPQTRQQPQPKGR